MLSAPEVEARRAYDLTVDWLRDLFQQARGGDFDASEVSENVGAILGRPNLLDALYTETFRPRTPESFLPCSSLNVAVYSLRLGKALFYDAAPLAELGTAALLAKIGLARVPEALIMKKGELTRREHLQIQEYPRVSRDMVLSKGPAFERAARIIYQANERIDGSGYPERLHEGEILEPALMIGLLSVFDALVQPRPYRDRLVPFAAVKELLERERAHFPRKLLREFISTFSAFPPFSYVRLNTRAIAQVVEAEPGHPMRPVVRVVLDASGRRLPTPQRLRLSEAPLLYITRPVLEEEIQA